MLKQLNYLALGGLPDSHNICHCHCFQQCSRKLLIYIFRNDISGAVNFIEQELERDITRVRRIGLRSFFARLLQTDANMEEGECLIILWFHVVALLWQKMHPFPGAMALYVRSSIAYTFIQ